MEIPSFLESQIREGRVIIFLGAGASLSARDAKGNAPPTGRQLGAMLSEKFLGGKYTDLPLHQIGEYAISESDLTTVQEYIREIFEPFEPSSAHRLMCYFSWHGIATTNYDRLIERAYETTPDALQIPKPFIENGDRVENYLRDPKAVMLLKLHGCITRTSNPSCPLILTTDQYIDHRAGRHRIFNHLGGWATERPLVFIGHGIQDPDLRFILLELTTNLGETRPRYYAVLPGVDEIQRRYWETKKVTLLNGTFEEFMSGLNNTIPASFRGLAGLSNPISLPIAERFRTNVAGLSQACVQFLQNDVEYVRAVTATEFVTPTHFYKGSNPGWSAIEQNLDVNRQLEDTILSDHFLLEESEHSSSMEVILVKAHAGAGKSVLLRRIAWDAAHDYNCLCLYVHPHGLINTAAIQELLNICKERIYLFVDDVADRVRELQSLANNIGPEGRLLTVIIAERINEWNVSCESISPLLSASYELRYLSPKEIDALISLLETHRALGTLEHVSTEGRRQAFAERAGRQLLVALHEATLGKRFEDIIEDEFSNIQPPEAQRIYLSICVLNRLNVPVRAGIISRIHGVPFEDFKKRLFAPLEHIVQTEHNPIIRDYMYRARHPHIAEIVFDRILNKQEEKFDKYIRCLKELNIDYSSDREAFRQMIRGRSLLDLFPNHDLVVEVFRVAEEQVGDDPHLFHQMALYEMHRPNGNVSEAMELLNKASRLAPHDVTIKHSIAEQRLLQADNARTQLEREKYVREARAIAHSLRAQRNDSYAYHTLVKVGLKQLKYILDSHEENQQSAIESTVKEIESNLSSGLQQCPGDEYLLESESQLANILSDSNRAMESLQKAFLSNPRSTFVAMRLARCYQSQGEIYKAKETLEKALEANTTDRSLRYYYVKLLMEIGNTTNDQLTYHLQRAFTQGDRNYDAQLLYGRQLFITGERESSKEVFQQLKNARVGAEVRDRLLYPLERRFRGQIARMESVYCFIARDGLNDWIYAHRNNVGENVWKSLSQGLRVLFNIAFSLKGPGAYNIELETSY